MSIQPKPSDFLISGNVRVADVLRSAGNEVDRILDDTNHGGTLSPERRLHALRILAIRLRRLAETIEKGK